MVRPIGAVTVRYKPCHTCGDEMPYKNIRKKYCDSCREDMAYKKKEEEQTARKQQTPWDRIEAKFRARRTEQEWEDVNRIARGELVV
jgi:hypothetical protein